MSCSGSFWLLGEAWFHCRHGGFWMSSCLLMFPIVRSSLMFSSFGVKPPASGFQSYSYSSLKIAPSVTSRAVLSSLFIFASSVCKSLWCLISTMTQRGESSHLFSLTCSVVLWGGRDTANKYHCVCWECLQCMYHTGFATVQGNTCFPDLHCSGSRVFCKGTVPSGPCASHTSQV